MSEAVFEVQVRLERWRDNSRTAVDALVALRLKTEENSRRLESPPGVLQFVDFFSTFFADGAEVFERVRAELEQGPLAVHAEALRQVASNAALEQRRCLQFRDKWINRPLPYEDVRPLLTTIVNTAANGLTEYRDVKPIADELDSLVRLLKPPADEGRPLDRRQLFTKWFGK